VSSSSLKTTINDLSPDAFFRRQKLVLTVILVVMIVITFLAGAYTNFETGDAFRAIPRVIRWAFANFIPDAKAISRLPNILEKLVATIFMSIMASVSAAVLAIPVALMGSRTTRPNAWFAVAARGLASIFRNIPVVAWAMIFLISFGQSSFTGFLALFFATFGFLTRAFMETIDEASASSVEALRAAGASYPQMVAQAVIPSSLPQMLSWMLYMIETNIRSATLVGLLTGSGIGFVFDIYYKSLQYKSAALVVICIVVVVLTIELVSNALRRVIL
jgi:phosphonate transport system permease protein